ncbi:small integral membrane protein 32 [Stigmatopora argus]
MTRRVLLNSSTASHLDLLRMARSSPSGGATSVTLASVATLLRPAAGHGGGGGFRDGELHKADLFTYVAMCLLLFVLVLIIVFFINCQLRNSFFASMPYDRSLREARTPCK